MRGPEYANYTLTPGHHPVIFQPGMHTLSQLPNFDWGSSLVEARYRAGDLTAHHWNPEVAQRIKNDRFMTEVIGLDTISGVGDSNPSWPWLPGSPASINGKDHYYVVGGDFLHWQVTGSELVPAMKSELDQLDWNEINSYALQVTGEFTGTALGGAVASVAAYKTKGKIGRRRILGAIGAAGLAMTVGRLAPVAQSYTTNPQAAEFLQAVAEFTQFRLASSTWLDARTALLTAKTIAAMDTLPDLEAGVAGSLVFGWPHGYRAARILQEPQYRAELIRNFLLESHPKVFEVELKYGISKNNASSRQDSLDNMARMMASYRVWRVGQPLADFIKNPLAVTTELIVPVYRGYCPEIVEALSPVSNPERLGLF